MVRIHPHRIFGKKASIKMHLKNQVLINEETAHLRGFVGQY